MKEWMLYGANGYTGQLIARATVQRNLYPILAGRSSESVPALANQLGRPHRVFGLDDPTAVREGLKDIRLVLNCAGPFSRTARALAEACLALHVDYLDVTGEIAVFEQLAALDRKAQEARVLLLPGVGFDVVPSDCLAVHLKRRLPSATHLALGFQALGRFSRGTATTMLENIHRGGVVRRDGQLKRVPAAWRTRIIDFGQGPTGAMTIPWGDVATAWRSTGIPDIDVYMAAPRGRRMAALASRYLGWLLGSGPVQRFLKARIQSGPPGPSDEERARGLTLLWGEARDATEQRVVARLRGPEGYTLTMLTALAVVERLLPEHEHQGFRTPA